MYVDELTVPSNLAGYGRRHFDFRYYAQRVLDGDFAEASGVGYGDATTDLQLTDNEFSLNPGASSAFGNIGVILDGQIDIAPESAWQLAPVVAPNITGNTFDADYTADPYGARFLAWDDSQAELPNATYVRITSPTTASGPTLMRSHPAGSWIIRPIRARATITSI